MAGESYLADASRSRLLALPNELLHETALSLATTDLQRLSQVNHELHSFVTEFLARYRYNARIFRLPENPLLRVVQQLDQAADRCYFAEASQKLYLSVMEFVIRYNITHEKSRILNHAAKNNLKHMAREIIRLGGDVDTRHDTSHSAMALIWEGGSLYTPLMNAASLGHEEMLHLLLKAGAGQYAGGFKETLVTAMLGRKKRSCEILATILPDEDMSVILKLAIGDSFVKPVRWILEAVCESDGITKARTCAFYHILNDSAVNGDLLKR